MEAALRVVLDAILHLLRTGCAWSALPDWAPPRSTVYHWFRKRADDGWLERLTDPTAVVHRQQRD